MPRTHSTSNHVQRCTEFAYRKPAWQPKPIQLAGTRYMASREFDRKPRAHHVRKKVKQESWLKNLLIEALAAFFAYWALFFFLL